MKKLKEIVTGFLGNRELITTSSCCGAPVRLQQQEDSHHAESKTIYRCPMACEGDKTYDTPGTCPVCNMHLTPVKKN